MDDALELSGLATMFGDERDADADAKPSTPEPHSTPRGSASSTSQGGVVAEPVPTLLTPDAQVHPAVAAGAAEAAPDGSDEQPAPRAHHRPPTAPQRKAVARSKSSRSVLSRGAAGGAPPPQLMDPQLEMAASPGTAGCSGQVRQRLLRSSSFKPDADGISEGKGEESDGAVQRLLQQGGKLASTFLPGLKVENARVTKRLQFEDCALSRPTLRNATFTDTVVFRDCTLAAPVFENVVFEKGVKFLDCEFLVSKGKRCNFERVVFRDACRIRNCMVQGRLSFLRCELEGGLDGWETVWQGWVEFRQCTARGPVDLRSGAFFEGLVFQGSQLEDVLLRGATVSKKLGFESSEVQGCLDLQKSKLHDFAYLEDTLMPTATIKLLRCIARFLLVRPRDLEGRLDSWQRAHHPPPLAPGQTRQQWVRRRAEDFETAAEEFALLKKNYDGLHWMNEEDWAYYHYKVAVREARLAAVRAEHGGRCGRGLWQQLPLHIEWLLFDLGCGYGTMPFRVFKFSFVLVLLFAALCTIPLLVYGVPDDYDIDNVSPVLRSYEYTSNPTFDALMTCVVVSFAVYAGGFDAVDKNIDGWLSLVFCVECVLGMLFFGLFVVTFSRKVIR